eukprot:6397235-Prymnesium_polylepis.1
MVAGAVIVAGAVGEAANEVQTRQRSDLKIVDHNELAQELSAFPEHTQTRWEEVFQEKYGFKSQDLKEGSYFAAKFHHPKENDTLLELILKSKRASKPQAASVQKELLEKVRTSWEMNARAFNEQLDAALNRAVSHIDEPRDSWRFKGAGLVLAQAAASSALK